MYSRRESQEKLVQKLGWEFHVESEKSCFNLWDRILQELWSKWGLLKGATLAHIRKLNYIDIFKWKWWAKSKVRSKRLLILLLNILLMAGSRYHKWIAFSQNAKKSFHIYEALKFY